MSRPSAPPSFPAGFVWGAATSAFRVEGTPLADGAGPSNWYRFRHEPGRINDAGLDHYDRVVADNGARLLAAGTDGKDRP